MANNSDLLKSLTEEDAAGAAIDPVAAALERRKPERRMDRKEERKRIAEVVVVRRRRRRHSDIHHGEGWKFRKLGLVDHVQSDVPTREAERSKNQRRSSVRMDDGHDVARCSPKKWMRHACDDVNARVQ